MKPLALFENLMIIPRSCSEFFIAVVYKSLFISP